MTGTETPSSAAKARLMAASARAPLFAGALKTALPLLSKVETW